MTDPYQILGVSRNATDDQIKRAYRDLSRKYHPDSYANNPLADLAEEKFKEVQEAYNEIMNSRSGAGYNSGYNNGGYQQGGGYGGQQSGGYGGQQGGGYGYGYQNQNQQFNNNRQNYQYYGNNYGRMPGNYNSGGCGTGNLCCDLWCADTLCECMGGDLCSCF